jgi:hypothetical protein
MQSVVNSCAKRLNGVQNASIAFAEGPFHGKNARIAALRQSHGFGAHVRAVLAI